MNDLARFRLPSEPQAGSHPKFASRSSFDTVYALIASSFPRRPSFTIFIRFIRFIRSVRSIRFFRSYSVIQRVRTRTIRREKRTARRLCREIVRFDGQTLPTSYPDGERSGSL